MKCFTEENWCFNKDNTVTKYKYKGKDYQVWKRETYAYNKDIVNRWSVLTQEQKDMYRTIPENHDRTVSYVIYPEGESKKYITLK